MRVFTRGADESLLIGNDLEVTVLEVEENRVRLGITSRSETPGYREIVVYVDGEHVPADRELQLN